MALNSCQFTKISQRNGAPDDKNLEKCSHRTRTIYRMINSQSAGREDVKNVAEIYAVLINKCNLRSDEYRA